MFLIVVCVCFGGCRVEQKQAEQTQEPCPKTIEVPYMGKGLSFGGILQVKIYHYIQKIPTY